MSWRVRQRQSLTLSLKLALTQWMGAKHILYFTVSQKLNLTLTFSVNKVWCSNILRHLHWSVKLQEELLEVNSALESENNQLQQQRAQLERIAISITAQMVVESQVILFVQTCKFYSWYQVFIVGPCSHLPFFVSGTFDLFNATCEQYHRNVFNPFLNGKKR